MGNDKSTVMEQRLCFIRRRKAPRHPQTNFISPSTNHNKGQHRKMSFNALGLKLYAPRHHNAKQNYEMSP